MPDAHIAPGSRLPSPLAAPPLTSHASTDRHRRWYAIMDGQLLRELRRQHGLTQADLAAKAQLSAATIARLDLLTEQDREFPQFSG